MAGDPNSGSFMLVVGTAFSRFTFPVLRYFTWTSEIHQLDQHKENINKTGTTDSHTEHVEMRELYWLHIVLQRQ
jgi:hypothetical protein